MEVSRTQEQIQLEESPKVINRRKISDICAYNMAKIEERIKEGGHN